MGLTIDKKINVDFYNNKLVYINAKQNDSARRIIVSCFNDGEHIALDSSIHTVYFRAKKPDDFGVFNSCSVDEDGNIIIQLTSQSLKTHGIMTADLFIYESKNVLLSTMPFCINIVPTPLSNSDMESSGEYKALNELVESALAEYDSVIVECKESRDAASGFADVSKSYAIGGTGTRDNEDTDNAKYYSEIAQRVAGNLQIATVDEAVEYLGINE